MQEHVNKERKRWYTIYIVDKRGKETKRITNGPFGLRGKEGE